MCILISQKLRIARTLLDRTTLMLFIICWKLFNLIQFFQQLSTLLPFKYHSWNKSHWTTHLSNNFYWYLSELFVNNKKDPTRKKIKSWEKKRKRRKKIKRKLKKFFSTLSPRKLNMSSCAKGVVRVAHFPAVKRETGIGYRVSRREMGVFLGNFPVLTKFGQNWQKTTKIWPIWLYKVTCTAFYNTYIVTG